MIDVPCTDFIDLYTNKIAMLERQIQIYKDKYAATLNEVNCTNGQLYQQEIASKKWSELAQNLQRSNETWVKMILFTLKNKSWIIIETAFFTV